MTLFRNKFTGNLFMYYEDYRVKQHEIRGMLRESSMGPSGPSGSRYFWEEFI